MWVFEIRDEIYNEKFAVNHQRRIFIHKEVEHAENWNPRRGVPWRDVFIVSEEWRTPEGKYNTGDWDFYKFLSLPEARTFIAELAIRLNTPAQSALLYAMEEFANWVTEGYKQFAKQKKKGTARLQSSPRKRRPTFEDRLTEPIRQQQSTNSAESSFGRKLVYVFDMGNGTVKIGITKDVAARRQTIIFSSGLFIDRFCQTQMLPEKEAGLIEAICHTHFDDRRVLGEFFKVPYQEAKKFLASISEVKEIPS